MKTIIKKAHINNLKKTTWCSLPWLHLFINPEGQVKPCCRFKLEDSQNSEFNLNEKKPEEIFFSNALMTEIRQKMLQNEKVDGCIRCYQEEESGKRSLRERYNGSRDLPVDKLITSLNKPKIRWIELSVSNDCNLACRMCDSRYSAKWFDDEKEFYKWTFAKNKKIKWNIEAIIPFLKDMVHIKFTGGEPLMTPGHFVLLDELLKLGDVSNIFLNYSTNLTIKPSHSLVEKWKKFKSVEIACSFDGVGKTWEFIRYPSQWEMAEKTLLCFFQLTHLFNCRLILRSTISIQNILGMTDVFKWWIKNWDQYRGKHEPTINPTHLTIPGFLSTTVLPEKYKSIVAEKLEKQGKQFPGHIRRIIKYQINYMFSKDDSEHLPRLKKYTLHFDKKRKQDFFQVNPEFKGLFDKL